MLRPHFTISMQTMHCHNQQTTQQHKTLFAPYLKHTGQSRMQRLGIKPRSSCAVERWFVCLRFRSQNRGLMRALFILISELLNKTKQA